jgi:hypothetical protein
MKTARSVRSPERSQAGAGTLQAPASPAYDDLEALRRRVEILETELTLLKGGQKDSGQAGMTEEWLYSPESVAEYKHAIRRYAIYRDRKPLEKYCNKTGGKVPRLSDAERRAS